MGILYNPVKHYCRGDVDTREFEKVLKSELSSVWVVANQHVQSRAQAGGVPVCVCVSLRSWPQ